LGLYQDTILAMIICNKFMPVPLILKALLTDAMNEEL